MALKSTLYRELMHEHLLSVVRALLGTLMPIPSNDVMTPAETEGLLTIDKCLFTTFFLPPDEVKIKIIYREARMRMVLVVWFSMLMFIGIVSPGE